MSRTKCRFAFPRLYPMAPVFLRMKLHENNTLALNGFVSGVALGGALCDYYQFHDRDYNMGSGYSIASTACYFAAFGSAFIWDLELPYFHCGRV